MAIANAKQLFQQGLHQQSIAILEKLLRDDPDFHHVHNILGEFYSELRNWDKARECYQTICRADANAHAAWINLSMVHKNQGRHDLEVACIEHAISIQPKMPMYWLGLALANMSCANYQKALIAFGQAVELQPQLAPNIEKSWLECVEKLTAENLLASKDDVETVKQSRYPDECGDEYAQYELGICYQKGEGVPKDDVEAVKCFRRSADQGNANAMYEMGLHYLNGKGVPQDDAETLRWFHRAAEQGYARAQTSLGVRYSEGLGVLKDYVEAAKWFLSAAAQQNKVAAALLKGIEKEMTPQQIAEAHRRANELRRKV